MLSFKQKQEEKALESDKSNIQKEEFMIVMVRLETLKLVMFMLVCKFFFSPLAVLEDAHLMWY